MEPVMLGTLALLALVDSTSFGTLLIPIWLLMTPGRLRVGRVLLFLGTVTLTYFAIGTVLLLGASSLVGVFERVSTTPAFLVVQLALGIALVVISFRMDTKEARARAAERASSGGGRLGRWRARVMGDADAGRASLAALLALAVTAVAVELATMLPYLAAIGILSTQGPGWPASAALLAGYCLVMIAPALLLTAARLAARRLVERPLSALDGWLTRNAHSTTSWVIGIVGALVGVRALNDLNAMGGLSAVLAL